MTELIYVAMVAFLSLAFVFYVWRLQRRYQKSLMEYRKRIRDLEQESIGEDQISDRLDRFDHVFPKSLRKAL